jgi:nucleoside-diphosphate-sugar epimerase
VKVLVAGASGTLGRPLVAVLRAGGHEVSGVTRTPAKAAALEATGARSVMVDALDAEALTRAVEEAAPEAIVHLLTALPRRGPTRFRELRATNRLRIEGTRNLIAAARAAGAHRLVAESAVFAYGFGDHGDVTLDESIALSRNSLGERPTRRSRRASCLSRSYSRPAARAPLRESCYGSDSSTGQASQAPSSCWRCCDGG